MEKKMYQKPSVKTKLLVEETSMLAASGEIEVIVSDDEEIKDGYIDSKTFGSKNLWEE